MSDDEIRQSRIDHWHMRHDIIGLVALNTPSRIGQALRSRKNYRVFFDYAADRYVEVPREPRRS